jgi:hypothetical protein
MISIDGNEYLIKKWGYGYDSGISSVTEKGDNRLSSFGVTPAEYDSSYVVKIPVGKQGVHIDGTSLNLSSFSYELNGEKYYVVPSEVDETNYNSVESAKYLETDGKYSVFEFKGTFKGMLEGIDSKTQIPFNGTYHFKYGARQR